jgi:predicted peptidase
MRKFDVVSITLLLAIQLLPASAQDFSLLEKRIYHGDSGVLPYRILYPKNYDRTKSYPLVLFLHGGGERGDDNEKQLNHGVKHFLEESNRSQFPCILIVPQCPLDSYWASVKFERTKYPLELDFNYKYDITKGLQLAVDLTRRMIKSEAVDEDRVYITGLSMGGMGTLEAVYRYPRIFAAAAVVCGGADEKAFKRKHVKTSFWLFHGDTDQVVGIEHSREMVAKLKSLGAKV